MRSASLAAVASIPDPDAHPDGSCETAPRRTGIFATLAAEHGDLERLIAELADLDDDQIAQRRELFTKIAFRLAAHADAEDATLYSVLASRPETLQLAHDARREHAQIESLVEELRTIPIEGDAWLDTFLRLQYAVRRHVENEQHELFPCARSVVHGVTVQDLDERYRARRHADGARRGVITA
jgi:hemerythrin-like domain-containing protein